MKRLALYFAIALAGYMLGFVRGERKTERTDLVTVAPLPGNQVLVTVFDGYGETIMRRVQSLDDPISTAFDF